MVLILKFPEPCHLVQDMFTQLNPKCTFAWVSFVIVPVTNLYSSDADRETTSILPITNELPGNRDITSDVIIHSHRNQEYLSVIYVCISDFRTSCPDFMKKLAEYKIPLLIFSAGIGNVIHELLKHKCLLFDNVRIVSNFMNFNNEVLCDLGDCYRYMTVCLSLSLGNPDGLRGPNHPHFQQVRQGHPGQRVFREHLHQTEERHFARGLHRGSQHVPRAFPGDKCAENWIPQLRCGFVEAVIDLKLIFLPD